MTPDGTGRGPRTVVAATDLQRRLATILVLGACAYGLVRAVELAWVSDDAFLSFRYAHNLLAGRGLVFNAGERVEGYTNFLWTLLMVPGLALGVDPVPWSQALGLLSFAGLLALLVRGRGLDPAGRARAVPVAAAAVAVALPMQEFATGGLETMFFTLLLTAAVVVLAGAPTRRALAGAGLLFTAATLARPDGALPYAVAAAWLLALPPPRLGRRALFAFLLPGVAIYLPYFAWRWSYYGFFFPNTYYAKSAGQAWLGQGFAYLRLYLRGVPILAAAPLAVLPLAVAAFRRVREGRPVDPADRAAALALAVAGAYVLWVVGVGGDFMAGRFLVPVTPLACLLLQHLARSVSRPLLRGVVLAGMVAGTMPGALALVPPESSGIVDERSRYPEDAVRRARREGASLRRTLAGLDARLVFYGSQAMLVYYADPPFAIEGETGLTDATLAHRPVGARTRPGHEKPAPLSYLRSRGVQLVLAFDPFRIAPEPGLNGIDLDGIRGRLLLYDPALLGPLRARPGVRFTPIDTQVARFEALAPSLDCPARQRWEAYFHDVRLDRWPDASLAGRVRAAAGGGDACPPAARKESDDIALHAGPPP